MSWYVWVWSCPKAVKQIQVPTCELRLSAFLYDAGMFRELIRWFL